MLLSCKLIDEHLLLLEMNRVRARVDVEQEHRQVQGKGIDLVVVVLTRDQRYATYVALRRCWMEARLPSDCGVGGWQTTLKERRREHYNLYEATRAQQNSLAQCGPQGSSQVLATGQHADNVGRGVRRDLPLPLAERPPKAGLASTSPLIAKSRLHTNSPLPQLVKFVIHAHLKRISRGFPLFTIHIAPI
jgi:hypothetical protein